MVSQQSLIISSDDPTRELLRRFMGAIHQYEKRMLVAKMKAAKDRIRASGERCEGRHGYRDSEEGKTLIRHINALRRKPKYGKRRTLQEVADYLNTEGQTTLDGKVWTLHRVDQTIKSQGSKRK